MPATTQAQLIAAVATLTAEVKALHDTVSDLREEVSHLKSELKEVTEFKNRSTYIATGVAIAFSAIGAMLTKAWGFFFPGQ